MLWYESGQLRDYAVFAAGAALTSAWFLHHHFWFLEVCKSILVLLLGVLHLHNLQVATIAVDFFRVLHMRVSKNIFGNTMDHLVRRRRALTAAAMDASLQLYALIS